MQPSRGCQLWFTFAADGTDAAAAPEVCLALLGLPPGGERKYAAFADIVWLFCSFFLYLPAKGKKKPSKRRSTEFCTLQKGFSFYAILNFFLCSILSLFSPVRMRVLPLPLMMGDDGCLGPPVRGPQFRKHEVVGSDWVILADVSNHQSES